MGYVHHKKESSHLAPTHTHACTLKNMHIQGLVGSKADSHTLTLIQEHVTNPSNSHMLHLNDHEYLLTPPTKTQKAEFTEVFTLSETHLILSS